jgi:hypothetical protein
MQRTKLLVVLALCLYGGAAVRADATDGQPVYTTTGVLPGVPAQGGVLGTLKVSAGRGNCTAVAEARIGACFL